MDKEKKNKGIMPPLSGSFDEVTKKLMSVGMSKNESDRSTQGDLIPEGELQICQFSKKEIRKVLHGGEWWFSTVDVVAAMTDSQRPNKYWTDLKSKLSKEEGFAQLSDKIGQLRLPSSDGKEYLTDCVNVETLFRIIQSIPSPKAEPFKRWLAKVGYERIQETQNPDIAIKRAIGSYMAQGRDIRWIEKRLDALTKRKGLTDEWKERGILKGWQYAQLTNTVHQGTFGIPSQDHKTHKSLTSKSKLREHMTDVELALIGLAETATKEITQQRDAQGFKENKEAAEDGGAVAGEARKQLEKALGRSVVSKQNFLSSKDNTMPLRQLTKPNKEKEEE